MAALEGAAISDWMVQISGICCGVELLVAWNMESVGLWRLVPCEESEPSVDHLCSEAQPGALQHEIAGLGRTGFPDRA